MDTDFLREDDIKTLECISVLTDTIIGPIELPATMRQGWLKDGKWYMEEDIKEWPIQVYIEHLAAKRKLDDE